MVRAASQDARPSRTGIPFKGISKTCCHFMLKKTEMNIKATSNTRAKPQHRKQSVLHIARAKQYKMEHVHKDSLNAWTLWSQSRISQNLHTCFKNRYIQSTLALRTPRYYGRSLFQTKLIQIPCESHKGLITDFCYYGITDTLVVPKLTILLFWLSIKRAPRTSRLT